MYWRFISSKKVAIDLLKLTLAGVGVGVACRRHSLSFAERLLGTRRFAIDSPQERLRQRHPATVLSPNLKLKHIVQSLPKKVFAKDRNQAWLMVIKTIVAVTLGMAAIAFAPWYLLTDCGKLTPSSKRTGVNTAVCGFMGYSYLQKPHSERGKLSNI